MAKKETPTEFENTIQQLIDKAMDDTSLQQIMAEQIQKGFENAITELFKYGDVRKIIETKLKQILVPAIEDYNIDAYVTKLDTVLTDIVKNTSLTDNNRLLDNFKTLMTPCLKKSEDGQSSVVKLSELFTAYKEYVSENIETIGRDVTYECGEPEYEPIEAEMQFEKEDKRSWSIFDRASVDFLVNEDDQAENLGFTIHLTKWTEIKENTWDMTVPINPTLFSLKNMSPFAIYLLRLERSNIKIEVDEEYISDEVYTEAKPELTYQ